MDEIIFKLLEKNKIYFCEEINNIKSSSVAAMLDCFDIYYLNGEWLFYRLKKDCKERGYIDKKEILIGPCEEYDKMVCVMKLFNDKEIIKNIESSLWIEIEDFHANKNSLDKLINEINEINDINNNSIENNNIENNSNIDDEISYSSEDSI